jgi:protein arginine kinase activator
LKGLEGLLKSMHKGTHHAGKVPEALRATREQSDRLKLLQKKLAKIEDENFEQAAQLRRVTTVRMTADRVCPAGSGWRAI